MMISKTKKISKQELEVFYNKYNRREYIHPDPLEFVYNYNSKLDKEITAFIASSLSYGNVKHILKSIAKVLGIMHPSPSLYLQNQSEAVIKKDFSTFKYRFTKGSEISSLLIALKKILKKYSSLEDCFLLGYSQNDKNVFSATEKFVDILFHLMECKRSSLIPHPSKGSACKRLNLFLRWMVRNDDVDPGLWKSISPAQLIVPLDTHMIRVSIKFGFIPRKQSSIKTALEVTHAFSKINPIDPVKYDFSLTRVGIRSKLDIDILI